MNRIWPISQCCSLSVRARLSEDTSKRMLRKKQSATTKQVDEMTLFRQQDGPGIRTPRDTWQGPSDWLFKLLLSYLSSEEGLHCNHTECTLHFLSKNNTSSQHRGVARNSKGNWKCSLGWRDCRIHSFLIRDLPRSIGCRTRSVFSACKQCLWLPLTLHLFPSLPLLSSFSVTSFSPPSLARPYRCRVAPLSSSLFI